MSFRSKSFEGKVASSFESTLQAVGNAAEPNSIFGEFSHLNNPLGSLSAPLDGGTGDRGIHGHWELLYEETEKDGVQESLPRPSPYQKPSAEALARELKLDSVRGAPALHKLRREFMWRNHPDRRPEAPREWANARVAIANMLIDRALREASKKKKTGI